MTAPRKKADAAPSLEELAAAKDRAVAEYRAAQVKDDAATKAHAAEVQWFRANKQTLGDEELLSRNIYGYGLERAMLLAQDERSAAAARAAAALDAYDVASGDPLSLACHIPSVREEVESSTVEVERLEQELLRARERQATVISRADASARELAARRQRDDLPNPLGQQVLARGYESVREVVRALDQHIAAGPSPSMSNATRLRELQRKTDEATVRLDDTKREKERARREKTVAWEALQAEKSASEQRQREQSARLQAEHEAVTRRAAEIRAREAAESKA